MNPDQKTVAALGRPFTLGMLYDAHKDALLTGFTLWDKKTIEERKSVNAQQGSSFEVTVSDSIESKSFLLDVDASLKASFLSGLIEVGGSAKYLNDQKKYKNQSRVTLQYKATTTFQQLSITEEEAKRKINPAVLESATHVVTGILYGANAFFVFDSEKLDASSVQDVQGSMQAVIKKIPTVDISGKCDIKLTDKEKALTDKFSCKFIGDVILPSNPSTFKEAVQAYTGLPKLLGKNQDGGVPLKVWLTPLKSFYSTAAQLKASISPALLRKAVNALEDVGQAEIRCNDSLADEVVENLPEILAKLKSFRTHCKDYRAQLQQMMEKKFPLIRKGQEENALVERLFEKRNNSPFGSKNLSKWLDNREREINIIRSCVKTTAGTNVKMVAQKSYVDRESLGVKHALCFVFTSVEEGDAYLDQMLQYLDSHDSSSVEKVLSAQDAWYYSDEVFRKMKEKAAVFQALAQSCKGNSTRRFLAAAVPNQKHRGATIYHYKDGVLVTDDFSPPSIRNVKAVTKRDDLIWYACDLTMDPKTTYYNIILSDGGKKATCGDWQNYPDCPERFDEQSNVLCKEALKGRHYWEVEWSRGGCVDVGVGVTYKTIQRKGKNDWTAMGWNDMSWFLGEVRECFKALHKAEVWYGELPPSGYSRIGVYLDWPAGILSYYAVTSDTLEHIYTFTTKFSEALYVGFWVGKEGNYVNLCSL